MMFSIGVDYDWGTIDGEKNDAFIAVPGIPPGWAALPSVTQDRPLAFGCFATCEPFISNLNSPPFVPPFPPFPPQGISAHMNNENGVPTLVGLVHYEVLVFDPRALRP